MIVQSDQASLHGRAVALACILFGIVSFAAVTSAHSISNGSSAASRNGTSIGTVPKINKIAAVDHATEHASHSPYLVLYDQYDNLSQNSITSQDFEPQLDIFDAQAADDFIIPAGDVWTIEQVDVSGAYDGRGQAESVNVFFYGDAGLIIPGAPVFTQTNIVPVAGLDSGNFAIHLDPPAMLPQGRFWVSVQANQNYIAAGQWFWRDRDLLHGYDAAWRNPGGGFNRRNCMTQWSRRGFDCTGSASSPDQIFRLSGSINSTPTPSPTGSPSTATATYTRVTFPSTTSTPNVPMPVLTQQISLTPVTGTITVPPGSTATPTREPLCQPRWWLAPSPNSGAGANYLKSVAKVSVSDIWAAGYYFTDNNAGVARTLIQHWDGVHWSAVDSPNNGEQNNFLYGLTAISRGDIWAVGSYKMPNNIQQTLILHWDGDQWLAVPSPNAGTEDNILYAVTAVSANDVWAVGSRAEGTTIYSLTLHWDGSLWTVVASPNPGVRSQLMGVSGTSANDVWAVGRKYMGGTLYYEVFILHWDGTNWTEFAGPNPGTLDDSLAGVTATAPNDVWAVGVYSSGYDHVLLLHWNGTAWSMIPEPFVSNQHLQMNGIYALTTSDIWAVGSNVATISGRDVTLVLHWNGNTWQVVPSPNYGADGSVLYGVTALDANDVWAVGSALSFQSPYSQLTLVEHLGSLCAPPLPTNTAHPTNTRTNTPNLSVTSTRTVMPANTSTSTPTTTPTACVPGWTVVSSPNPGAFYHYLNGVAAASAHDVWAVGSYSPMNFGTYLTLVEHWDGTSWSVVPSPSHGPSGDDLLAVAVVSPIDVWAVGDYISETSALLTLVEHWDGTSWSITPSPSQQSFRNLLNSVVAISPTNVWAVGDYFGNNAYNTLAEHWDGTSWSIVPTPNQGSSDNYLNGVTAISGSDVWAVGYYVSGTLYNTLIEHWDGASWSIVASPNKAYRNYLFGVAAITVNDVWAVGENQDSALMTQTTLVEHWDGTSWSIVPSPNGSSSENALEAVTKVSAQDVWAVGYYRNGTLPHRTLVEHWDGTSWSVVSSPNHGGGLNILTGAAAVSSSDVWAVGDFLNSETSTQQTLIVHYMGCNPATSPTPTIPEPTIAPIMTPTTKSTVISTQTATAIPISTSGLTPTPTSCLAQFSDVPQGSTFYPFVRCLACRGIINGYADGTFKPNNLVTRGQLSKIVSNSAGFNDPQTAQMFQDVAVGSTFQVFAGRLASRGYISGYACGGAGEPCVLPGNLPYFRPNNNATRGQISKIVSNAASFIEPVSGQTFQDVPPGNTFYDFIERLASRGVMGGYPCGGAGEPCVSPGNLPYFRPNNNATRGQTSKIVANTFYPGCQTPAR